MPVRNLERWHQPSQRVVNEEDPQKLTKAIGDLNSFLEENLRYPQGPGQMEN